MNTPQKTIRLYLLLSALFDLGIGFISATYVLFLLQKGLNLFEANLVNVFFYVTLAILEIPTGAFADVYGRKPSFVAASGFFSIGFFCYSISDSFWGFALAETISAVGATFMSGAFQAWMKDQLAHEGQHDIRGVLSAQQVMDHIVGAIGAVLGVRLLSLSPSLPWLVGGMMTLVAGAIGLIFMREDYFVRRVNNGHNAWHKLSGDIREGVEKMRRGVIDGIRFGVEKEPIRFLLVLGLTQQLVVTAPNMQWQPFFAGLLGGNNWIGWFRVGMSLFLIIGATVAPWCLKKAENERLILSLCQIAIGLGVLASALMGKTQTALYAVMFFLLHEIARGIYGPAKNAYLHDQVPSESRATMISVEAMSHHIGGGIGLAISGWLALRFGIVATWVVFGLLLVFSAAINFRREHKNRR